MKRIGIYFPILAFIGALSGCVTTDENTQLADVNKDWNRMIRASHIFPVYPLSQDIMPGDVFFVSSDIDNPSPWDKAGYLPLDHLVARLYPSNYPSFYQNSWPNFTTLPQKFLNDNSWSNAPVAGFPSYSFTVSQGGGANVSLPIQGIPVGLSLMGAGSANGMVTLADAHTYGVDEMSLRNQVWHYIQTNQNEIKYLLSIGQTNYLQVVSRVFVVGQVTVSMQNSSSEGVSLWGEAQKTCRHLRLGRTWR
jgi:hypothetical protein